jgi:uncharacterized protein YbjT (DUF2867 family)
MRILLAGATGIIGRQAVPVLRGSGHQVIGLARLRLAWTPTYGGWPDGLAAERSVATR